MTIIDIDETIEVGRATVLGSDSPTTEYGVVFEDDGHTGYFYAVTLPDDGFKILDAMQIYVVRNVVDRDKPSKVNIVWSEDGLKAALFINQYPHAIFNFEQQRGYSRMNFPQPDIGWNGHEWHEDALALFE